MTKRFHKVVVLDTVIFYPEHRRILHELADEVLEYPSSLPESLERQYEEQPESFRNIRCYTELGADNTPLQLLMNRVEEADVIISCWTNIPDEILRLNPQLRLIVFWTHEKEHRVNIALAEKLGITVKNIPDYGTDAVAEVVFAGLYELQSRRLETQNVQYGKNVTNEVMLDLFRWYRQIQGNEKYTRAGKFTHHFHKLGKVRFDFEEKSLDELIPEHLLAGKRIGFWGIADTQECEAVLSAFRALPTSRSSVEYESADFYKFLAEHDRVYYDPTVIEPLALQKAQTLFDDRLVNLRELPIPPLQTQDKTFGILGLGRIGQEVARRAHALGYNVVYHSHHRDHESEQRHGYTYVTLRDLLQHSDVLSIHLPAHKAEGLLDCNMIALLKPGMFFINTADGNVVDQRALTKRLLNGEITAYLDVYPGLPRKDVLGIPMADSKDWKLHGALPKCVLAYRAGWKTQESIRIKTYKLLGAMAETLIHDTEKPTGYSSSWRDRREQQASVRKTEDGGLRPPLASIA